MSFCYILFNYTDPTSCTSEEIPCNTGKMTKHFLERNDK